MGPCNLHWVVASGRLLRQFWRFEGGEAGDDIKDGYAAGRRRDDRSLHWKDCVRGGSQRLRGKSQKLLETTKRIVLNLSGVTYIDSGGLGTLVGMYSSARAQGADIKPDRSRAKAARRTIDHEAGSRVFEVYDTEQEATAAFQGALSGRRHFTELKCAPAAPGPDGSRLKADSAPFRWTSFLSLSVIKKRAANFALMAFQPISGITIGPRLRGISIADLRPGQRAAFDCHGIGRRFPWVARWIRTW